MKSVGTFDSGKELLDLYSEMPLRHSNMHVLMSSGQHIKTKIVIITTICFLT